MEVWKFFKSTISCPWPLIWVGVNHPVLTVDGGRIDVDVVDDPKWLILDRACLTSMCWWMTVWVWSNRFINDVLRFLISLSRQVRADSENLCEVLLTSYLSSRMALACALYKTDWSSMIASRCPLSSSSIAFPNKWNALSCCLLMSVLASKALMGYRYLELDPRMVRYSSLKVARTSSIEALKELSSQ